MLIQGQVGIPTVKQTSGNPNITQGYLTELLVSELNPAYYSLLKGGRVFFANASGTNSAFIGATGGIPMVGIMNPASSGYDIVVLQTRIGVRTTGGTGGSTNFSWWGGPSVLPTGTQTQPTNAYSLATTGSASRCFINTAMTSSTALNQIGPVLSIGTAGGTAGLAISQSNDNTQGTIIAAPGNLIAIGCAVALATSTLDVTVIWAELPA